MNIDPGKTYIGIVEDNNDPKKLGRCRIRVIDIFDDIEVVDIPWASPWKDLNGNEFILPEKGKILTVVFDSGNIYKPEYIYAEHYNINLENKLKKLSGDDYTSMRSLMFDHKTQIYSNDKEGLIMDYKFNKINITKSNIDICLKDNYGKINIGDASSDQEAILGTNFLKWFDEFVDNLLGSKGGPYLGNFGSPVVPNPELIQVLVKYKALKQPKFLSKNVFITDNTKVTTIRQNKEKRENNSQIGDKWKSTKHDNKLSKKEPSEYSPKYGTGSENPSTNQNLSTGGGKNPEGAKSVPNPTPEISPELQKIFNAFKKKSYKLVDKLNYLNLVGVRYQNPGQIYSNTFSDRMWGIWKSEEGKWESRTWTISTMPGLYNDRSKDIKMKKFIQQRGDAGLTIMAPSQYLNIYSFHEKSEEGLSINSLPTFQNDKRNQKAYLDKHFEDDVIHFDSESIGDYSMYIHRGFPSGVYVDSWSEGSQVFGKEEDYSQLCELSRKHLKTNSNKFNYTLILSSDIE